jgi:polyisoprenoid-binding protein YceI
MRLRDNPAALLPEQTDQRCCCSIWNGPRLALHGGMKRRRFLMTIFALAATAAGALEPDQVQIAYQLKMGTGEISGVSHELDLTVLAIDDQSAQVHLRVPIDSFDSGHPDFDSRLRAALDARQHPFAEIEGALRPGRIEGTLDLRGVKQPVSIQLTIERVAGNVIAAGSFAIDLRDYGVALEGVDPHASIDLVVRLVAAPGVVLAGGFTRQTN